jgi:hypothetical protein
MARPEKLESLSDVIRWIVDHDARIDVYWEQQHALNIVLQEQLAKLGTSVIAINNKLYWFCGVASVAGGMIGHFVTSNLS